MELGPVLGKTPVVLEILERIRAGNLDLLNSLAVVCFLIGKAEGDDEAWAAYSRMWEGPKNSMH